MIDAEIARQTKAIEYVASLVGKCYTHADEKDAFLVLREATPQHCGFYKHGDLVTLNVNEYGININHRGFSAPYIEQNCKEITRQAFDVKFALKIEYLNRLHRGEVRGKYV